jgi:hypothetical protein
MRMPILIAAACLLMWHGVLQAVPHAHGDDQLTQERLNCWASHPMSPEFHLHATGQTIHHQICLACLAGPNVVGVAGTTSLPIDAGSAAPIEMEGHFTGGQLHTDLPVSRGPPRSF